MEWVLFVLYGGVDDLGNFQGPEYPTPFQLNFRYMQKFFLCIYDVKNMAVPFRFS